MYEAVTTYPDGGSTVSRFAATADSYGYDGIVVRTADESSDRQAIEDRYEVDIVDAVEIDTDDPAVAAGHVGNLREQRTLISVRGGSPAINRYAVEEPRVDVLTAPMAGDGDINHVLAAAAARNGVRVEYRLGPILRRMGAPRVRAVSRLRKLREVLTDSDTPFVVSADPRSHLELRSGRDLAAVGEVVGFDESTIRAGLAEWGVLADRNRDRLSEPVVEPGVRIDEDPPNEPTDREEPNP